MHLRPREVRNRRILQNYTHFEDSRAVNLASVYKSVSFKTIYTQFCEETLQNFILRIILRGISVPTAPFIRSLEIRHPSNPTFAYKLDPFITDYTQVSRDALQNRKIAYNSIPFATDYTQSCEDAPQNHIFAYKVEDISVPTAHFIRS